jgi:IS30 family transposase
MESQPIGIEYCRPSATFTPNKKVQPLSTIRSLLTHSHLNKVARQLNQRPRKALEFETPAERFNACVASTG